MRRVVIPDGDEELEDYVQYGVLEISNSKSDDDKFTTDEEFYAVILAKQLNKMLTGMAEHRTLKSELSYYSYFYNAFTEFIQCDNHFQLQIKANEWISTIFSIV